MMTGPFVFGAVEGEQKMTKPNTLTQRKRLTALLLARDVKINKTEIAKLVGVSRNTLYEWLKEDAFRELVEKESKSELDDVRAILDKGAFLAALKELELLGCGEKVVEARVAGDILDRTGYAKVKRMEADIAVSQKQPSALEALSTKQLLDLLEFLEKQHDD